MLLRTASMAAAVACLTGLAALPAAHAQNATYPQPAPYQQANPYPQPAPYAQPAPYPQPAPTEELVTNGPQPTPGDRSGEQSARQNVIQSQHYDRLLETNRGFREARMRKECGPITDPQLHASCMASFRQDEPVASAPTRHRYRNG